MMNPIKFVKCLLVGHKLEKSIVKTICSNNWLKKCSCCGLYFMHGELGTVPLTEKAALKVKREFEEEFPYARMDGEEEKSLLYADIDEIIDSVE